MEDYEGAGILGIEPHKKGVAIPQSRKEKLKAELQLLEWHKMANNAAIKGALLQTKSLRQQTPNTLRSNASSVKDDERWIKSVIQQEHIKPLEVSKDYVLDYERREKENAEHLSAQVDRHVSTLKSLRQRLEARHDLKTRTEEYRQWQREFLPKKHAVLLGKTLAELDTSPTTMTEDDVNDDMIHRTNTKRTGGNKNSAQELTTVLDSLSRLAELEQRISSLEQENRYDELIAKESPTADQRTAFEFRKKRAPAGQQGPVGLTYEVRQKDERSWKVNLPQGAGSAAVRGLRGQGEEYESDYADDSMERGDGVFITAGHDQGHNNREALRRERARNQALAPAGQKQLKQRILDRRSRAKEQQLGVRKHEAALKEMARRKNENEVAKRRTQDAAKAGPRIQLARKGISTGQKTGNRHMVEFESMKSGFRKRKEDLNRNFQKPPPKSGIERRFVSQTAPVYSQPHPAAHPRGSQQGKAATITANNRGVIGRRPAPVSSNAANAAARRAAGSAVAGKGHMMSKGPVPAIAVTGMGGLRVLKQQQQRAGKR